MKQDLEHSSGGSNRFENQGIWKRFGKGPTLSRVVVVDFSSIDFTPIELPEGTTSIFGYGSLLFKPPPFNLSSTPGYIKGFVRRFAQESHDHRGTEEHPGRVVTLVTEQDWESHRKDDPLGSHHVWGKIYHIPPTNSAEIWAYLDHREKDGYTQRKVDVYGTNTAGNEFVVEKDVRVYVGETDNPSFAGGEEMEKLSSRIAESMGPSGLNKEYLYEVCNSVRQLCPQSEDQYLAKLEKLVRGHDEDKSNRTPGGL